MAKGMDIILKLKGMVDKTLPGNLKKIALEIRNLQETQKNIKGGIQALKKQKELKKEIEATVLSHKKIRNELKTLEIAKKKVNGLTEQEKQKYDSLTKKSKALEKTIKEQSKAYQKYGMEIKKLKIPFNNLQSELEKTIKKEKELLAQQKIMKQTGALKGKFQGVTDKIKTGVKYAATVGLGVAIGVGKASVDEYLNFSKQMIKVKALTGATTEEYELLRKKAMEVGKTTIFTSEEAAAGMEKFALAGFKPKQIIEAIPPIFDLATASGEDFTMISDLISDHMVAFNLSVNDIGYASDILANTMSRSNTNIGMLGEAFKYVSSSAKDLNIDLSTTSAAIGLMGDQAIKSGQAGRNLKQAFSKIADKEIQEKLKRIGVNVKDSKGEFIGLVDFVKQLQKASKMPGIDKLGMLKDIFGEQGSLAINKLLTARKEVNGVIYEGADALAQFANENENAIGKAKEMANTILEDDSGKIALLKSAYSDVKLKIGQAIFKGGGANLIKLATDWLNELSNVLDGNLNNSKANLFWQSFIENGKIALEAIKNIGKTFWGVFKVLNAIGIDNILVFVTVFNLTSKAIKFGNAIATTVSTIKAAGGVLSALKVGITALGGPISLFVAMLALAGYWTWKNWDTIKVVIAGIPKFFKAILAAILTILYEILKPIGELIVSFFKGIIDIISNLWNKAVEFFKTYGLYLLGPMGVLIKLGMAVYNNWDSIKSKFTEVFGAFKNIIKDTMEKIKEFFARPFELMKNTISGAKEKAVEFLRKIPGMKYIVGEKEKLDTASTIDGSHRNGLDFVPFDGYIAELHKGERVLTKEENKHIADFDIISIRKALAEAAQKIELQTQVHNNIIPTNKKDKNSFFESYKYITRNELLNNSFVSNIEKSYLSKLEKFFELYKIEKILLKEKVSNFFKGIPGIKFIFSEKERIENSKTIIDGSHRAGLKYVPFDGYIAELHKGERVLTKEENQSIFGRLKDRITNSTQNKTTNEIDNSVSNQKSNNFEIHNHYNFTGVSEETKDSIIEKIQEYMRDLEKQIRKLQEAGETYARTNL